MLGFLFVIMATPVQVKQQRKHMTITTTSINVGRRHEMDVGGSSDTHLQHMDKCDSLQLFAALANMTLQDIPTRWTGIQSRF